MQLVTYAQNLHDLNVIKALGMNEVILECLDFSRFGKLSLEQLSSFSNRSRELGLRIVLEWDILMTQGELELLTDKIKKILPLVDVLRVQDPGALEWSLRETDKPIQFIAENGNHNLLALKSWIEYAKSRIERLVLSLELPRATIEEYCQKLKVPCELLGVGRILLFYTPRGLLSALRPATVSLNNTFTATGESEESPHKGFPIIENAHGTFMFHIKDFFVADQAADLKLLGLSCLRIDLRWGNFALLGTIVNAIEQSSVQALQKFKEDYGQDFMRGFYHVNKTDVLFSKLKNNRLQNRDHGLIGEVIESEKGSHIAIEIKNQKGLNKNDIIRFIHPKGQTINAKIYSLKNLSLEDVDKIENGQIALIQFVGGIWVKSLAYYAEDLTSS